MYGIELLAGRLNSAEDDVSEIIILIDSRLYNEAQVLSTQAQEKILKIKTNASDGQIKNEAYIYDCFFNMLSNVARFWKCIEGQTYYDSWWRLHDIFDDLRCLKKFYKLNNRVIDFLVKQMKSIEGIYPYKFFSSPGFIVERYDCSICDKDMDGDECQHFKGELYDGEMAIAIAKKIKDIDHFAIVENPKNKRLAISGGDGLDQFNIFKELVEHFNQSRNSPLGFTHAKIFEFMRDKDTLRKTARNEACHCGSGKKFKKCCINTPQAKQVHVDFYPGHLLRRIDADRKSFLIQ